MPFRLLAWCVLLALSSLLIVACGGDDDDEADAGEAPTGTVAVVATPTAEPEPTETTETVAEEITLSIEPSSGPRGAAFDFTYTGLVPEADYIEVVLLPDGTEDRQSVTAHARFPYMVAAESGPGFIAGERIFGWLNEPGEPAGEYTVQLLDAEGETVLAEATFTVTEATAAAPAEDLSVSVEPASGVPGTYFFFTWSGLTPQGEYVFVATLPDGTEERHEATANSGGTNLIAQDDDGSFWSIDGWQHEEGEPTGEFVVELRDADGETVLAEVTFTVTVPVAAATPTAGEAETPDTATDGPSIRVSPESGTGELPFLFFVEGVTPDTIYDLVTTLPDGEEFAVEAIYDEETMELVGTSGEYEGFPLSLWYVEPGDPDGEYTVELRDPETDEVLASATFTVE